MNQDKDDKNRKPAVPAKDQDIGHNAWAQAQERELTVRPTPTRRAQYELTAPGKRTGNAIPDPSPLAIEDQRSEEGLPAVTPSKSMKSQSSIREFGRSIVRKMSFGVKSDVSKPRESQTEDDFEDQHSIGRKFFERPGPLARLARATYEESDDGLVLSTGDHSYSTEGGLGTIKQPNVHRGVSHIASQHALLENVVQAGSHTESHQTHTSQLHPGHISNPVYTPSVYSAGVWEHDPRVGTTIPPYDSSPADLTASGRHRHVSDSQAAEEAPSTSEQDSRDEQTTQEAPDQYVLISRNDLLAALDEYAARNLENFTQTFVQSNRILCESVGSQLEETRTYVQEKLNDLTLNMSQSCGNASSEIVNEVRALTETLGQTIRDRTDSVGTRIASHVSSRYHQVEAHQHQLGRGVRGVEAELQRAGQQVGLLRGQISALAAMSADGQTRLAGQVDAMHADMAERGAGLGVEVDQIMAVLEAIHASLQPFAVSPAGSDQYSGGTVTAESVAAAAATATAAAEGGVVEEEEEEEEGPIIGPSAGAMSLPTPANRVASIANLFEARGRPTGRAVTAPVVISEPRPPPPPMTWPHGDEEGHDEF